MEAPAGQPPEKQTFRFYAIVTLLVLMGALAVFAFAVFMVWVNGGSLAEAVWLGPLVLVVVVAVGAAWDWIRRRALARWPAHHH